MLRRGRTRTLKRLCIWVLGYRHTSHLDCLVTEAKKFTDISIEETCLSDTRASDSSGSASQSDEPVSDSDSASNLEFDDDCESDQDQDSDQDHDSDQDQDSDQYREWDFDN